MPSLVGYTPLPDGSFQANCLVHHDFNQTFSTYDDVQNACRKDLAVVRFLSAWTELQENTRQ